jgi:hypothetical protein
MCQSLVQSLVWPLIQIQFSSVLDQLDSSLSAVSLFITERLHEKLTILGQVQIPRRPCSS